ncbi:ABC transporter permease [Streptomyces sp. NPDC005899]|uniref:ABC transporter permease n=1 Tax=Streptomyces sp. NPDC005899 TaxID=3155716 RepID=UPI0033DA5350
MAMPITAVLRSEWVKITSLRSVTGTLTAIFAVSLGVTVLTSSTVGQAEAAQTHADPVFSAFYALNFGQIAAISFGATAVSSEFLNGALRISLAAVPRRGLLYAAKISVIGGLALVVGLVTSFVIFVIGQMFTGEYAIGLREPGVARAAFGGGVYLALMALLAAGLTATLRSAVAVLSVLIPFVLIASFVMGDALGAVAQYLPDRAGQLLLHQDPPGNLGPWEGLAITAGWTTLALVLGWWTMRNRDA